MSASVSLQVEDPEAGLNPRVCPTDAYFLPNERHRFAHRARWAFFFMIFSLVIANCVVLPLVLVFPQFFSLVMLYWGTMAAAYRAWDIMVTTRAAWAKTQEQTPVAVPLETET